MEISELPTWAQTALAIVAVMGVGYATVRKALLGEKNETKGEATVLAGGFHDRSAMTDNTKAVTLVADKLDRLIVLLEADAQRRHDEAIVRQALKERGIVS